MEEKRDISHKRSIKTNNNHDITLKKYKNNKSNYNNGNYGIK